MKENLKPYVYKHTKRDMRDVVLFVERSGELLYEARLRSDRTEAEGKPSLKRARVSYNRPEARRSIHVQVEAAVKRGGGPNRSLLKKSRMRCG